MTTSKRLAISSDAIAIDTPITDHSSDRLLSTVYQNKTGRNIMIIVGISCALTAKGDSATASLASGLTNSVSDQYGQQVGLTSSDATTSLAIQGLFIITAIIPPNYFYKITSAVLGTGVVALNGWTEFQL